MVCPTGYLAIDGDVAGGGLTGGYSASLEKCKDDCEARSDCNSFVHSTNANSCKLMEEAAPTHPKWKDGQFCKKDQLGTLYLSHVCDDYYIIYFKMFTRLLRLSPFFHKTN